MVIMKIQGGLGNQMFEYASGLGIARKIGKPIKFDLSGLTPNPNTTNRDYELDAFNLQLEFVRVSHIRKFNFSKKFPNTVEMIKKIGITIPSYVVEKKVDFNENMFDLKGEIYLDGYWQSEKYFSHIEKEIRNKFVIKKIISEQTLELMETTKRSNSVAIQIRRGDYITNPKAASLHGILDSSYYQRAIEYMNSKISNPVFFIISDDLDWAQKNMKVPNKIIPPSKLPHEHMALMNSCNHHIISNSSFGWWGAWLGKKDGGVVIAPKKWFAGQSCNMDDRLPVDWLRM